MQQIGVLSLLSLGADRLRSPWVWAMALGLAVADGLMALRELCVNLLVSGLNPSHGSAAFSQPLAH